MKAPCSVDGCIKPVQARGMCNQHYHNNLRHGTPVVSKPRAPRGSASPRPDGYMRLTTADGRRTFEHILVAERALGKRLPKGAIVHHVDENPGNNIPTNLVICPDQAYHKLLHLRMEARDACGNPNYRKCKFCKQYDDPSNLVFYRGKTTISPHHAQCAREAKRAHNAVKRTSA